MKNICESCGVSDWAFRKDSSIIAQRVIETHSDDEGEAVCSHELWEFRSHPLEGVMGRLLHEGADLEAISRPQGLEAEANFDWPAEVRPWTDATAEFLRALAVKGPVSDDPAKV